ncbi:hypothetical protein [Brevundimonas sp.]|uniref:DUF7684 family protein n=1 Tax=Brevundimonas sp. TaxID=1871086 RepID=UPI0025F8042F|nr:hypothetical protein [Brevundimonas sp.]
MKVSYLHLPAGGEVPAVGPNEPFKAIVVAEQAVDQDWRAAVSRWLVSTGCLYMMAWGVECASWDDSVDWACLHARDFADLADYENLVMTTWHEQEALAEAFWFAGHCAHHPAVALNTTLIVHISSDERREELLRLYDEAQRD